MHHLPVDITLEIIQIIALSVIVKHSFGWSIIRTFVTQPF